MQVAVDRVEVVPDPERIESEPVHEQRVLAEPLPGRVLGPEVDAELEGHDGARLARTTEPGARCQVSRRF